jgi:carbonic anhydrase/acetyltransferase-like protein (isoleucine patch superfamily)
MSLYTFKETAPQISPEAYIVPTAVIIGDVSIAAMASVWFNCVVRGDVNSIRIGEESNIQDLTMLHADKNVICAVGKRVTIGHSCVIHGCTIEDDCLIGMGAVIMNNAVIGRGSIVAAGSVVTEKTEIPPLSLVTGTPGKVKRALREDIVNWNRKTTKIYTDRSEIYRNTDLVAKINE